jgi:hypothetical protein
MRCPCRKCPVLPMCITRKKIDCEILSDFLNGYTGGYRHEEIQYLYKTFNAGVVGYNDFSTVVNMFSKEEIG